MPSEWDNPIPYRSQESESDAESEYRGGDYFSPRDAELREADSGRRGGQSRCSERSCASRFHRSGWVYEEKYDGWRLIAFKDGHRVRLVSRQGVDHTERLRELTAVAGMKALTLILDGEAMSRSRTNTRLPGSHTHSRTRVPS
jgi:ATP dependent DNA ligase-like protein